MTYIENSNNFKKKSIFYGVVSVVECHKKYCQHLTMFVIPVWKDRKCRYIQEIEISVWSSNPAHLAAFLLPYFCLLKKAIVGIQYLFLNPCIKLIWKRLTKIGNIFSGIPWHHTPSALLYPQCYRQWVYRVPLCITVHSRFKKAWFKKESRFKKDC